MPNIVAWSPSTVAVPMAATQRSTAEMKLPELPTDIVAPPPQVSADSRMRTIDAPQTNIVAPPPSVQMATIRQSDIDIGHSEVVGPAPKLPMAEQHRMGGLANSGMGGSANVVPPPPSVGNTGTGRGGGQLIALSVRPAPAAASIPQGNRRGTFAATPQGKPGAPATPDLQAGSGDAGSNGGSGNAPAGIYVGKGPDSATTSVGGNGSHSGGSSGSSSDSRLLASATPPRVSTAREVSPEKVTEEEKKVFGDRKFYSMSLNMPNLNSAGGSWVIHFAEMKDSQKGDLSAPVARQKVDPAYPTELMRQNVAGTVTLYAVIHSDGSVDGVKVLSSADDRLNEYARSALTRWRFYPATKNGNPVDLEAVVAIPFRPIRVRSSF
jgi:TonB family protein